MTAKTSRINPYNIDGTYPVAGQDNNSQGFRDNFTNTKNNLAYAKDEIDDLQLKSITTAQLTSGPVLTEQNDMQGSPLLNATIRGFRNTKYDLGSVSGAQTLDFANGSFQTLTTAASVSISAVNNWPNSTSIATSIIIGVTVTSTAHTLTFPAAVSMGASANTVSKTITFTGTGTYFFELTSLDGGSGFYLTDKSRAYNTVQGALTVTGNITASGNISAGNLILSGTTISGGSSASYTGNVTANYFNANAGVVGNVLTAAQPNITSVGTLSTLTVSGAVATGALTANSLILSGATSSSMQYETPTSGSSTQLWSNVAVAILTPGSTLANATVLMPASPVNGQRISIGFGATITSLTHSPSGGQTLNGALTSGDTSTFGTWVYKTSTTTWYRIG